MSACAGGKSWQTMDFFRKAIERHEEELVEHGIIIDDGLLLSLKTRGVLTARQKNVCAEQVCQSLIVIWKIFNYTMSCKLFNLL